jgi:tetratricopeptide (TPR) repeat protein
MVRLFALLAVSTAGCFSAYRAPLTCPAGGGPAWTELTSAHYRIRTDLGPVEARAALVDFEQTYAAFEDLGGFSFPSRRPLEGRIDVYIFQRHEDFVEVAGRELSGFFRNTSYEIGGAPTIGMFGRSLNAYSRMVFQHELTHRFIRHYMPDAPVWLSEGLAQYHESLELRSREAVAILGKSRRGRVAVERLPSVAEVMSATYRIFHDREREDAFYRGAWAWVHHLNHTPALRPRFIAYLKRLGAGDKEREAWSVAFAGVDLAGAERDMRDELALFGIKVFQARYQPRSTAIESSRSLDDAGVHLAWVSLRSWVPGNHGKVLGDLEEAERRAPGSAEVAYWRALFDASRGRAAEAEAGLRKAVAANPDEPRYQLALADHLYAMEQKKPVGQRKFDALREPLKHVWRYAKTAAALNLVGWLYAEMGQPDIGLPFARRAVEVAPGCWACIDTLAKLRYDAGFIEEALELQTRAVGLMPERSRQQEVLERLKQYQEAAKTLPP